MITYTTLLNSLKIWGHYFWTGPALWLLLGVGIYQTWRLKGVQLRYLWSGFKLSIGLNQGGASSDTTTSIAKKSVGDISAFQALMTSLAGSIGTGNITGIATALSAGGVGALFWMWIIAFFGMATAYSETILAIKFRRQNEHGEMAGGPMYTLMYGLRSPKLAKLYALIAMISAICIGCLAQANSMTDAITDAFNIDRLWVGILIAIIVGAVIVGGVRSIGRVSGVLVPFKALAYIITTLIIIGCNFQHLIPAIKLIFNSAFSGQAAAGGFLGSTVALAIQSGAQYGIFANEAGMGSLAIAAASAKTTAPVEQGLRAMVGVFLATMVVCTLTGLVIAVTQVLGTVDANGQLLSGTPLVMAAFRTVHSSLAYVLIVSLLLFALTTIVAWSYYGEKCIEFLFGVKVVVAYRWLFTICIVFGAVLSLDLVWAIAGLATACMALPNLISIVRLSKQVVAETNSYFSKKILDVVIPEFGPVSSTG